MTEVSPTPQRMQDIVERGKMSIETRKFIRKTFEVEAVRVTSENLKDVAKWCDGVITRKSGPGRGLTTYIEVEVHHPLNERQTKAFVGDWVLFAGKGFKVYSDKALGENFDPAPKVEFPEGVISDDHTNTN